MIQRSVPCGRGPYWDVITFEAPVTIDAGVSWTAYPDHEDPYYTFQVALAVTVVHADGSREPFLFETSLHDENDPGARARFERDISDAVRARLPT